MPSFSRTLPDLVDKMNNYNTALIRCIENNKIYDAITFLYGMNSQLDDANRVIFSTKLSQLPRADEDLVHCPFCNDKFKPKPNLAVIVDSLQPLRKCAKCDEAFNYVDNAIFIKHTYNIYPEIPEIDDIVSLRNHRGILYNWFNGALNFIDSAYRQYRLNYKGGGSGKE